MTRLYVDVGVVRIQEYILRTSGADRGQLRLRRGASQMISEATAPERFCELGLERNDETYTVEGVAHLSGSATPDGRDTTRRALLHLRAALPNAYLEGSWATAEDYAEALQKIRAARIHGLTTADAGVLQSVPATREDPCIPRCRACGQAQAADGRTNCADCRKRDDAGQRSAATTAEQVAIGMLTKRLERQLRPVPHLGRLASLPTDPSAKLNHIATVYADGNNVGALFQSLPDLEQAKKVSEALDTSIKHACTTALAGLLPHCSEDTLPGVVTTMAADDVLVTVPASLARLFTVTLLREFSAQVTGVGSRAPISLTAGVVFSHVKHPIEIAITAAADAMRRAKQEHPGVAAIGFRDLTQDTHRATARTFEWFGNNDPLLTAVAGMPRHQTSAWARALDIGSDLADEEVLGFIRQDARRAGLAHADRLSGIGTADLRALLDLARWWSLPAAETEEGTT